jgi:phage terminase small subunit|tara:strand:- start:3891 stop:4313 length:423 start_codon:yes stop_codon:yes gene_type:complete
LKYEDLAPKKQLFVDSYIKLGDRKEAFEKAGYSVEGRGWTANARALFLSLEKIITERVDMKIGDGAVVAFNVVREIMVDKDVSPAVRLNAAKDYLNRAGYDVPIETRVNINDERNLSNSEIEAEIARIQTEMPIVKLVKN